MAASAPSARNRLARDRSNAVVAGVCSGIARRFGIDPIIVRVLFVVAAVVTRGGAVAAYVLLWIFMDEGDREPAPGDVNPIEAAVSRIRVANWRIAAGVGFLTLAFLLVLREIGLWWSDALVWPLILAASGAALLWNQSTTNTNVPPASSASPPGAAGSAEARDSDVPTGSRDRNVYRGGFGIALVLGAALLFLYANGALGQARDVVLGLVVAGTALALILAPFLWRLGRNLAAERSERIRSQERAEVAAHLHDSVLQTLALMQKRADDPKEIAALARRQERELRAWLFEGDADRSGDSLAAALDHVAAEVEDAHGVPIDVVSVGDRDLDERGVALVAATREALTNAAKFAGDAAPVAVYAEMEDGNAQVFVRDRGPGFDAAAIPTDRRGVRESIIARMERHGGRVAIRSTPGAGTEVELAIEGDGRVTDLPTVVIVDDHAIFRSGVRTELEGLVDVRADVGSVEEAVRTILTERPDVVLLDVHMPGGGGVEVIRRVGAENAGQRFLALSVSDAAEDVIAVVRAGARGYVTKTIAGPDLANAVSRVRDGDAVFSPRLAGFVLDAFAGQLTEAEVDPELDQLTTREREVLRLIARGYLYKEIALQLSISPKTVEAHVSAVLRKLQLSNRHELSRWAVERRLVD